MTAASGSTRNGPRRAAAQAAECSPRPRSWQAAERLKRPSTDQAQRLAKLNQGFQLVTLFAGKQTLRVAIHQLLQMLVGFGGKTQVAERLYKLAGHWDFWAHHKS